MEQEVGYGWCEGVHFEDYQVCMDTFVLFFNKRQAFTMEYRLQRADGAFRWILDNGRPYWNGSEFAGYIGSCIDITQLREARENEVTRARLETKLAERERMTNNLITLNRELDAFSARVSHDLQAPLNSVYGFVDLSDQSIVNKKPDDARRYLEKSKNKIKDLEQLIVSILDLSKVSSKAIKLQTTDFNAMLKSVQDDLTSYFSNAQFTITTSPFPSAITADPVLIRQVFFNILSNSVKYNQHAPLAIELQCTDDGTEWRFAVIDHGVGVKKEHLARIFLPYERFVADRSTGPKGHGLGLSIVHKIVELHQGSIWAEETPGGGLTVRIHLPKKSV